MPDDDYEIACELNREVVLCRQIYAELLQRIEKLEGQYADHFGQLRPAEALGIRQRLFALTCAIDGKLNNEEP